MNFMVANFLSEQARAHRSSRVSDIRADLVAAQTQASSNASTSSRTNPSSTTEAAAVGGDPDGGEGETAGAPGSGSEPFRPRGMASRSPASPALDAHALVRSCIGRAEAMLPPHGITVPWGGVRLAPPGMAGLLHVLLLLATGVTETQRETLVSTRFHLRVRMT